MNCPYCLSEIDDEALCCKFCTRDVHLFKSLLARVAELEGKLNEQSNVIEYEARIVDLNSQLEAAHRELHAPRSGPVALLLSLGLYIVLPLFLLLLSHALITIILDTKLIYLRLLSIAIPLPFGIYLFLQRKRSVMPWFLATAVLAVASVIGMSWVTSMVDNTPVFPQNTFEWREYLEYAASISFSFMTGMLIGSIFYARKHRHPVSRGSTKKTGVVDGWLTYLVSQMVSGKLNPKQISELVDKLQEIGSSAAALGATAMSIYTGLKAVLGN